MSIKMEPFRAFVRQHLAECCKELTVLSNTGVLPEGKVREATKLIPYEHDAENALLFTRRFIETEAVHYIAHNDQRGRVNE